MGPYPVLTLTRAHPHAQQRGAVAVPRAAGPAVRAGRERRLGAPQRARRPQVQPQVGGPAGGQQAQAQHLAAAAAALTSADPAQSLARVTGHAYVSFESFECEHDMT